MKKIICIGSAAYDITIPMEDYPTENIKYRVKEKIEGGGGPASNAAYLLGKWNTDVYFAGVVGDDNYGRRIESEFKAANVNTKYMEFDKGNDTTISFIIVNKKTGSRTIFAKRDENIVYNTNINLKVDYILVDGQEYEASVNVIKNNKNAISVIDAGRANDNVINLAKLVNYVVCSKEFAETYTSLKINLEDSNSIVEVFNKMKDFKNVIITLEDKGCLYKKDGVIMLMPSIKVEAKDSTGAGDYFHGAFMYCLIKDFEIKRTLKICNVAGALSVTKVGGRNSVPSLEEVMKYV